MNLNKVLLIGRLTETPDLRTTPTGQSVASFGLATNRFWVDKNRQRQEETEFHTVVVWGRQAEIASQFLQKGSLAHIEGRLRTRSWNDATGNKRKVTEVIAERVQFGPRNSSSSPSSYSQSQNNQTPQANPEKEILPTIDIEEEINTEDLPF